MQARAIRIRRSNPCHAMHAPAARGARVAHCDFHGVAEARFPTRQASGAGLTAPGPATAADGVALPWWIWPIALFAVSFIIGIVAVLAGVGGGVLFVPIVGSFFPFHLDFVRGVGLLFALSGTLAAGPVLLRTGMANLRLVMPLAFAGSIASLAGAVVGLSVATDLLQIALGATVIAIAIMIWATKVAH